MLVASLIALYAFARFSDAMTEINQQSLPLESITEGVAAKAKLNQETSDHVNNAAEELSDMAT